MALFVVSVSRASVLLKLQRTKPRKANAALHNTEKEMPGNKQIFTGIGTKMAKIMDFLIIHSGFHLLWSPRKCSVIQTLVG